jgi:hypothetical protein
VDNGNGTVTDNKTGLMWEKKSTAGTGDVHDVNNYYYWTSTGTAADGTLYTAFIAGLNGGDYYSPSSGQIVSAGPGTCFVNHCDWRIPTIAELQGILLAPYPCSTSPCIDAAFGPTQASVYSSSSSLAGNPGYAWAVHFFNGYVENDNKYLGDYTRAVRGGR